MATKEQAATPKRGRGRPVGSRNPMTLQTMKKQLSRGDHLVLERLMDMIEDSKTSESSILRACTLWLGTSLEVRKMIEKQLAEKRAARSEGNTPVEEPEEERPVFNIVRSD